MPRRWFRVACVSYDPDYETYFGRLRRRQRHAAFRRRAPALRYNGTPVKVFRTINKENGAYQYWATDDLEVDLEKRDELESMGGGPRSTAGESSRPADG